MSTVSKLLAAKGHEVLSVNPKDTVFDAMKLMVEKGAGSLLVIDKNGKLAGLISERDGLRKVLLKEKDPKQVAVKDIMSKELTVVNPDTSVDECMAIMTEKRIRHLPVMEKGRLVGIVSIGDAVKFMVSEKDFIIKNLEQYIAGG